MKFLEGGYRYFPKPNNFLYCQISDQGLNEETYLFNLVND